MGTRRGTWIARGSGAGDRQRVRWRTLAVLTAGAVSFGAVACSGGDDGGGNGASADASGSTTTTVAPATPSAGCDNPSTDAADLAEDTMEVRGTERRYLLSSPAWEADDEPLPLVLDFHGLSEGADIHAQMTQLGTLGANEGFITAFPHGTGEPVGWNVAADPESNDDLAFVSALLDRLEEQRCIDTSRVYATGLSNGAMMSSTVACTMADRVAAIAPIAGVTMPDPCEPSRPVPVMTVHGTADPILLFNGGVDVGFLDDAPDDGDDAEEAPPTTVEVDLDGEGYPATVRQWAELGGCEDEATDEPVGDQTILRTYDCPEDMAVEFYIVEGGGHSWPSSEFSRQIEDIVGPTTFDIDASQEAWDFFTRFHLPPS